MQHGQAWILVGCGQTQYIHQSSQMKPILDTDLNIKPWEQYNLQKSADIKVLVQSLQHVGRTFLKRLLSLK